MGDQLVITSVSVVPSPIVEDVEVTGIWLGEGKPPAKIKNFYYEDDILKKDIFNISTNRLRPGIATFDYRVSYRLAGTVDAEPAEVVLDYFLGDDVHEYSTWNLRPRYPNT